MFAPIIPRSIDKYGVDVQNIGAVQKGYRSESYPLQLMDKSTINLLFYKREDRILDRIRTADAVAAYAASKGLPVRTRYDRRLLQIGVNSYAGLYTYLPGRTISWEAYTQKHIKLLGWAMADLHTSLKGMPIDGATLLVDELSGQIDRMEKYFTSRDVVRAIQQKLELSIDVVVFEKLRKVIGALSHADGQQYLHMDMVRGNVLFDEAHMAARWHIDDVELSGIIDFEKAAYGLPVCDAARTLAFLLVDCPKPSDKVAKYFLDSGYKKRGQGSLEHIHFLPSLVRLFLIYDFYKFLRHTPYESLKDNYHYNRTHDLLRQYGMIS